jgi:predicted dienelactone hydrolase
MGEFSVGCRTLELRDEQTGDGIPLVVFYPAEAVEKAEALGPYTIDVARDAEQAQGRFPLVVISHGTGGSHLVYRTLARYLARRGFVVACPEHPRNNRNNNELGGTDEILVNRPRHLRIVMDWAGSDEVAVIGHSLGGYTGLAVAGGAPFEPDGRVKALVLLAPATVWFMAPGALERVRVPILMLTAEKDPHTPPLHADIVLRGVRDRSLVEHRVVENAGHFSFLSPFPEGMMSPAFAPSQDPEGFDRTRFQEEMNREILAFLRRFF